LQDLRNRLQALPPLVFSRAVNEVLPGSKSIFGSVQAEDVIKELKEKHGIVVDKVSVQGTKIKAVGDSWARVDLADLGIVELKVVVERR
jgi:ribosomal protein L9